MSWLEWLIKIFDIYFYSPSDFTSSANTFRESLLSSLKLDALQKQLEDQDLRSYTMAIMLLGGVLPKTINQNAGRGYCYVRRESNLKHMI